MFGLYSLWNAFTSSELCFGHEIRGVTHFFVNPKRARKWKFGQSQRVIRDVALAERMLGGKRVTVSHEIVGPCFCATEIKFWAQSEAVIIFSKYLRIWIWTDIFAPRRLFSSYSMRGPHRTFNSRIHDVFFWQNSHGYACWGSLFTCTHFLLFCVGPNRVVGTICNDRGSLPYAARGLGAC